MMLGIENLDANISEMNIQHGRLLYTLYSPKFRVIKFGWSRLSVDQLHRRLTPLYGDSLIIKVWS